MFFHFHFKSDDDGFSKFLKRAVGVTVAKDTRTGFDLIPSYSLKV